MLYKLYIILLFYFYIYRQISLLMVKYGYITTKRGNLKMENSKEEYLMLRDEILKLFEIENNIINIFYTVSAAIMSFSILQEDNVSILIVYMIIIPSYLMLISKEEAIYKIGTYLYEFYECNNNDIQWEHYNREFCIRKNKTVVNDISLNFPFIFVNVLVFILFLLKTKWNCITEPYILIKIIISILLFLSTTILIILKGKVKILKYNDIWNNIKNSIIP